MNTLESQAPSSPQRSLLSDWIGDPVSPVFNTLEGTTSDDVVLSDHQNITERMIEITQLYPETVPIIKDMRFYRPTSFLFEDPFASLMRTYATCSWDSITVRMSVTDPKGIAGGCFFGWFPYKEWTGDGSNPPEFESQFRTKVNSAPMLWDWIVNMSPCSNLINYGASKDIEFTIPWCYISHMLFRDHLLQRIQVGDPILFLATLPSYYVSTQTDPPLLRVFLKFNNLRFQNPALITTFSAQSGELVAGAAIADLVATAAGEIVSDVFISSPSESLDNDSPGTFGNPSSVQLSYAGDIATVDRSKLPPLLSSFGDCGDKHDISSLITQPQYIGTAITEGSWDVRPCLWQGGRGAYYPTTWLSWFSYLSTYWRGTLFLEFVIQGHALVETNYKVYLRFTENPDTEVALSGFSQSSVMEGICKGPTRIVVPVPFATMYDKLFCSDYGHTGRHTSVVKVFFTNRIVSTMLNVPPVIPTQVFLRAGPDFQFYFPRAPGMWNAELDALKAKAKERPPAEVVKLVRQVGIDLDPILFQSRAFALESLGTEHHPIIHVEDYLRYWCRFIPAYETDINDEPIPNFRYANCPSSFWFDSAAWTPDVNNSWFICQDYISFISSMYLFYRGSIACKVMITPRSSDTAPFVYVANTPNFGTNYQARSPFTISPDMVPYDANPGVGSVVTPSHDQPFLEFSFPFNSPFSWNPCNFWDTVGYDSPFLNDYSYYYQSISSNVILQNSGGDLQDSLFRKAALDFSLRCPCLPAPPYLWMARGNDWS